MKLTCASLLKKVALLIFNAYSTKSDPAYQKLEQALIAVHKDDWKKAKAFLHQIEGNFKAKEQGYKDQIPAMLGLYQKLKNVITMCDHESASTEGALTDLALILKKSEEAINKLQYNKPVPQN